MEYVIKSNVPDMGIAAKCLYPTKEKAVVAFKGIYKKLSEKCPPQFAPYAMKKAIIYAVLFRYMLITFVIM